MKGGRGEGERGSSPSLAFSPSPSGTIQKVDDRTTGVSVVRRGTGRESWVPVVRVSFVLAPGRRLRSSQVYLCSSLGM